MEKKNRYLVNCACSAFPIITIGMWLTILTGDNVWFEAAGAIILLMWIPFSVKAVMNAYREMRDVIRIITRHYAATESQSVKEGNMSQEDAKEQTLDYVYDFIDEAAKTEIKVVPKDFQILDVNCPFCKENGKIRKLKWGYACENAVKKEAACHFKLSNFDGMVTEKDVAALATKGITRKITAISKSKKTGKPFNARLKLVGNTENGIQFAFEDPEELPVKCPYCNGKIVADRFYFHCEHNDEENKTCNFAVSRHDGKFTTDDLQDLLEKGRTRYIENLVSKKGKTFTAAFVLNKNGEKYATKMVFPSRVRAQRNTITYWESNLGEFDNAMAYWESNPDESDDAMTYWESNLGEFDNAMTYRESNPDESDDAMTYWELNSGEPDIFNV